MISRQTGRALQILRAADGRLILDAMGAEGPQVFNGIFMLYLNFRIWFEVSFDSRKMELEFQKNLDETSYMISRINHFIFYSPFHSDS